MTTNLSVINRSIIDELRHLETRLPENYSAENALKSAALAIEETVDKNKQPALKVCSETSIKRALLSMVIQGLNPSKDQCYFLVRANKLILMRSYMGSIMLAKSVDRSVSKIRSEVVYEDDEFTFEVEDGVKIIKMHTQSLKSINKNKIIGAYSLAFDNKNHLIHSEIMTIDEIHQAWKSSPRKVFLSDGSVNPESTHGKYPGEMAKRTVSNRMCKIIINTSDDENILYASSVSDEERDIEILVSEEVKDNAGKVAIDFKKEPQKEIEIPPMATKEHFDMIMNLANRLNCKDRVINDINALFNRKISRISELTAKEAEEYIDVLDEEIVEMKRNEKKDDGEPAWAAE